MKDKKITERLAALEQRAKSNTRRIDSAERNLSQIRQLTESVAVLAERMKNFSADVSEIKSRVEQVRDRPAHAADKLKWVVITAVCSLCASLLLVYFTS